MKDSILMQTRLYMLVIILLMGSCDLLQLHSVTRETSSLLGDMGSGKRLNGVIPFHYHIPKMPAYYDVTCIHLESIFFLSRLHIPIIRLPQFIINFAFTCNFYHQSSLFFINPSTKVLKKKECHP